MQSAPPAYLHAVKFAKTHLPLCKNMLYFDQKLNPNKTSLQRGEDDERGQDQNRLGDNSDSRRNAVGHPPHRNKKHLRCRQTRLFQLGGVINKKGATAYAVAL